MKENFANSTYMYREKPIQGSIFHVSRKKTSPSAATGRGRFHLDVTDFKLPNISSTIISQYSQKHIKSVSLSSADRIKIDEKGSGDTTIPFMKKTSHMKNPDPGSVD